VDPTAAKLGTDGSGGVTSVTFTYIEATYGIRPAQDPEALPEVRRDAAGDAASAAVLSEALKGHRYSSA